MKKLILCICLLVFNAMSRAQNQVPNPGFEEFHHCPTSFGQIWFPGDARPATAKDWYSVMRNSPDYFNSCSDDPYCSVPNNFWGYKPAHTGGAYAAIVVHSGNERIPGQLYAEYIGARLITPLVAGQTYKLSCYVKPIFGRHGDPNTNIVSFRSVNMYFSDTMVVQAFGQLKYIGVPMYAPGNGFLADTVNWVKITGYFKAKGGEEWLTIGGLYNTERPEMQQLYPEKPVETCNYHGYYSIDDISVTANPACDTVSSTVDTAICMAPAAQLMARAGGDAYLWSTGATGPSVTISKDGTYWCRTFKDCSLFTDSFIVTNKTDTADNLPTIIVDACPGDSDTLTSSVTTGSYRWNTGGQSRSIIVNSPGTYICYTPVNTCTLAAENFLVRTPPGKDCNECIWLPSAFTPNTDGLNDVFRAVHTCTINKFTFRIYNRWGQEVFYATDPRKGWNGMHGADIADVGTYFYFVEYNTIYSQEMKTLKGDLLLIR